MKPVLRYNNLHCCHKEHVWWYNNEEYYDSGLILWYKNAQCLAQEHVGRYDILFELVSSEQKWCFKSFERVLFNKKGILQFFVSVVLYHERLLQFFVRVVLNYRWIVLHLGLKKIHSQRIKNILDLEIFYKCIDKVNCVTTYLEMKQ